MQQTKNIYLRLIQESDVDFLLNLRTNPILSQYLNQVDKDPASQLRWLKNYKIRETAGTDYYFIIVDKKLGDIGLVRVYNIDYLRKSFTWGSWVIQNTNRPKYAAIESSLVSLEFAFSELGLSIANIDVKIENQIADNFYQRFGMEYKSQDHESKYYILTKKRYIQLKFSRYYKWFIN